MNGPSSAARTSPYWRTVATQARESAAPNWKAGPPGTSPVTVGLPPRTRATIGHVLPADDPGLEHAGDEVDAHVIQRRDGDLPVVAALRVLLAILNP